MGRLDIKHNLANENKRKKTIGNALYFNWARWILT